MADEPSYIDITIGYDEEELARRGIIIRHKVVNSPRKKPDPSEALINQTLSARAHCVSNPTDFACEYAYKHDVANLNPVGGGPGYTNLVNRTSSNYFVNNKAEFLAAMSNATAGETVWIESGADVDLTGVVQTVIPGGITIASDYGVNGSPGGLIRSDSLYIVPSGEQTLETGGTDIRITGIRLQGPSFRHDIQFATEGIAMGCLVLHTGFEMDNCFVTNWVKWGIQCRALDGLKFHHNLFSHTTQVGFGYPIWLSKNSTDTEPVPTPLIDANMFHEQRHVIGSAGSDKCSYIARYNYVIAHSMPNHQFDRHGDGGPITHIINNISYSSFDEFFGGMSSEPVPKDIQVIDNQMEHEELVQAILPQEQGFIDVLTGNEVDGVWRAANQPTATISSDVTEGLAPLTVTFTATGAEPTGNFPINAYLWELDNNRRIEMTESPVKVITFDDPGLYVVGVRSRTSTGIVSSLRTVSIWVQSPTDGTNALKDRLAEWWEFDETLGSTRTGSHRGIEIEDTLPEVTTGVNGNAARYNGVDNSSAVDFLDMEPFEIYEDDLTISMRVKFTAMPTQIAGMLSLGYLTMNLNNTGQLQTTTANPGPSSPLFQTANNSIIVDEWIDVTLTLPRQGRRRWFTDGVLKSTATSDNGFGEHYEAIYAGISLVALSPNVIGKGQFDLDRLIIWKRILTDAEILAISDGTYETYSDID